MAEEKGSKGETEVRLVSIAEIKDEKYPNRTAAVAAQFEVRCPGKLSWRCDIFNSCNADFNGTVWLVDVATGNIPTWRLIETTCNNGCDPQPPSDKPFFHQVQNATQCYFGWGNNRDGKHESAWARATFYSDTLGVWTTIIKAGC